MCAAWRFLCVVDYARRRHNEQAGTGRTPLMKRQRLTLEQSLLLALCCGAVLGTEQAAPARWVRITVDSLLPQWRPTSGPPAATYKRKRLGQFWRTCTHGMVSDVDAQDCITIRPRSCTCSGPKTCKRCCCAAWWRNGGSADGVEGAP